MLIFLANSQVENLAIVYSTHFLNISHSTAKPTTPDKDGEKSHIAKNKSWQNPCSYQTLQDANGFFAVYMFDCGKR